MQPLTIKKRGKTNQRVVIETAVATSTKTIRSPENIPSNLILALKKLEKINEETVFTDKEILSYDPTIEIPTAYDPNESGRFSFVETSGNEAQTTVCKVDTNKHSEVKNVDQLCWWCCHKFKNKPYKMPVSKTCDGTYECVGNFCSPECTCTYILDSGYRFGDKWKENELLHEMVGTNTSIKAAPQRELLNVFGGELTIDEFRGKKKYNLVFPPMVSLKMHMDDTPNEKLNDTIFSNNAFKLSSLNTGHDVDFSLTELKKKKEKHSNKGNLDRFWGCE
tara:strand:- start:1143 stop:1976 length:834 start_codon:yes stop_codon:yes gene_type:complete